MKCMVISNPNAVAALQKLLGSEWLVLTPGVFVGGRSFTDIVDLCDTGRPMGFSRTQVERWYKEVLACRFDMPGKGILYV